jgi:heme exporter protein C
MEVPRLAILNETIRNLFYHVALWFAMFILLIVSMIYSIKYLKNSSVETDTKASEFATMGVVFGLLGIATGSVWARFTWGDWWVNDPKLNATTIALLIYLAYFVLRSSIEDHHQKGESVPSIIFLLLLQLFLDLHFAQADRFSASGQVVEIPDSVHMTWTII